MTNIIDQLYIRSNSNSHLFRDFTSILQTKFVSSLTLLYYINMLCRISNDDVKGFQINVVNCQFLNNSLHQPIFSLIDLSHNKSEAKMLTKGIIANKMCAYKLIIWSVLYIYKNTANNLPYYCNPVFRN